MQISKSSTIQVPFHLFLLGYFRSCLDWQHYCPYNAYIQ